MAWRDGHSVVLKTEDANDRRIRDLELAMVIGRTRRQMDGPRTPDVKAAIVRECDVEQLPWDY